MFTIVFLLHMYFLQLSTSSINQMTLQVVKTINTASLQNIYKIEANPYYIVRLSSKLIFNVWDIKSRTQLSQINQNVNAIMQITNSTQYRSKNIDFSINKNNQIGILTQKIFILQNIQNGELIHIEQFQNLIVNSKIRLTQSYIFLITGQNQLKVYNKNSLFNSYQFSFNNIFYLGNYQVQVCQAQNLSSYIVLWNQINEILIIKCDSTMCIELKQFNQFRLNKTITQISFNQQCKFMAIQQDNYSQIKIWNLKQNRLQKQLFKPRQIIHKVQFYDKYEQNLLIFCQNSSILLYNVKLSQILRQFNILTQLSYDLNIDYSEQNRQIYMFKDQKIQIYDFQCKNGSIFNNKNQCQKNKDLFKNQVVNNVSQNIKINIPITVSFFAVGAGASPNPPNTNISNNASYVNASNVNASNVNCSNGSCFNGNSSNGNSTTNNTSGDNSTNNLNNSFSNGNMSNNNFINGNMSINNSSTGNSSNNNSSNVNSLNNNSSNGNNLNNNNSFNNSSNNSSNNSANNSSNSSKKKRYSYTSVGQQQQVLGIIDGTHINFLNDMLLNPLSNAASYSLLFIQVTPLAIFFVGFIKFWNVCSLYALVQTDMPYFFRKILDQIYFTINISLLRVFNINIDLDFDVENRFQGTNLQYFDINSNFFQMHKDDILIFLLSCLILLIVYLLRLIFSQIDWINKKLKFDNQKIIFIQFLATSFIFVLPLRLLFIHTANENFKQKTNLILHISMLIIALSLPFFTGGVIFSYKKYKNPITSKQIIEQERQECIELFDNSICLNHLAFYILLDILPLTFIGGFLIHIQTIVEATKARKFRLNKIILSLHIFIFHLSFFSMVFFGYYMQYELTKNIFGFICVIMLITGAIHQVLNLIFQIFYGLYKYCKSNKQIDSLQKYAAKKNFKLKKFKFKRKDTLNQIIKSNKPLKKPPQKQYVLTLNKNVAAGKSVLILNSINKFQINSNYNIQDISFKFKQKSQKNIKNSKTEKLNQNKENQKQLIGKKYITGLRFPKFTRNHHQRKQNQSKATELIIQRANLRQNQQRISQLLDPKPQIKSNGQQKINLRFPTFKRKKPLKQNQ